MSSILKNTSLKLVSLKALTSRLYNIYALIVIYRGHSHLFVNIYADNATVHEGTLKNLDGQSMTADVSPD